MIRVRYCLICLILGVMFSSCSESAALPDTDQQETHPLLLSVGSLQDLMRQSSSVVQTDGNFRGLQDVRVIPFRTSSEVTINDSPLPSPVSVRAVDLVKVEGRYHYYIKDCPLFWQTNRLLLYGRAVPEATSAENGVMTATWADEPCPADITFGLPSIMTGSVHDDAQALADYLTAIATTPGWSTTTEPTLKALYENFTNAESGMAGSARNVTAYVNLLKEQVATVSETLSDEIIARINDNTCLSNDYPGRLGLPDGAAVLRWNGSAFEVRTQTTTLDHITGIDRYVYPAELWYYVDSPIRPTDEEVAHTEYETTWDALLNSHFKTRGEVSTKTKAVAVEYPMQYGVARLQVKLQTITGTLRDAKDHVVDYHNNPNTELPFTGIVVGGQHPVGFNFKPQLPKSDADTRFIYDSRGISGNTQNTLVLQSYDGEKVPVALELENRTGKQIAGKDGIIYPNTRFYLIAEIDPAGQGTGDCAGRVFTQDYTTTVNMRVTSLANAYNCMPDLLEPRLEIGVQLTTKWEQTTPTNIILN